MKLIVEIEKEVIGDFFYNSPQSTVKIPTMDGSLQPTPNKNSYDRFMTALSGPHRGSLSTIYSIC